MSLARSCCLRRGCRPHRPIAAQSRCVRGRGRAQNWRVISMDLAAFQHFIADAADDGVQQRGYLTDPARQRRGVDVQAWGRHHLGLPVKRQMMFELRDDDMRQLCKCRLPAGDRLHRDSCLDDLLTRPVAIFRSDVPHHAPVHRQDIEQLMISGTALSVSSSSSANSS